MKIPGPDHPITITPSRERVRVTFNGKVVADTSRALVLQEASYKPVFYIPREDAQMALTAKTAHSTHCPYKGDATYYTIKADGREAENAIWSYETPFPAMKQIEGTAGYATFNFTSEGNRYIIDNFRATETALKPASRRGTSLWLCR